MFMCEEIEVSRIKIWVTEAEFKLVLRSAFITLKPLDENVEIRICLAPFLD